MTSGLKFKGAPLYRFARFLSPYWRQWIVILICVIANAGLVLLPPLLIRGILDNAIPNHNKYLLLSLAVGIVGINALTGLISILQEYLNLRVGQNVMADLRNDLFQGLQRMSLPFYSQTRVGEIVSRLNNDVAAIQNVTTNTFVNVFSNLLIVIGTFCVIFSLNWRIALLALVLIPILLVPTRLVGRLRRRLSSRTQESQADLMAFLQERLNIGGMLLTKIFGQAHNDRNTFAEHNRKIMELNIKQALSGRWLFWGISVAVSAIPALFYWYGGSLAIEGELTTGTIIAFITYITNLYRPLSELSNIYVDLQGAIGVYERIFEFLDLKPEVEDHPEAITLAEVQGHIQFENVVFTYPRLLPSGSEEVQDEQPKQPFTLNDVSFEIQPGERVALVGPSGAGKTTMTYLMPRFLDPESGNISLDGHDLRDITQESLRSHIGMVMQETFLFHGTVRDNLLYARPDATMEQIQDATQAAYIHDVIVNLPFGYDTVVGERAFRLSGGERQRLSIARALLKDPKILVLDEATSNLDATSEYLIQGALEKLLKGRTSLIVAHRLSTILSADKILVLNKGRLVESGTHEQLLKQGGLYTELYHQQLSRVVEQKY